jgi:anaerobic C4-dicarboxylate transporter
MDSTEKEEWARRLRRTQHPCGCKSGAIFMLLAIVGWPVRVAITGLSLTLTGLASSLLTYLAVVVASALIGKLAGIAVGRLRHRYLKHQFARRLSAPVV